MAAIRLSLRSRISFGAVVSSTLTRSSVNLKEFQAKAATQARRELLEEQAAKLAALPNKGGVTDDTKAAIRLALGITA